MDSLFDALPTNKYEPLPVRMRPTELDHLYGQEQAVGKGTFLRAMVERIQYHPCCFTDLVGLVKRH